MPTPSIKLITDRHMIKSTLNAEIVFYHYYSSSPKPMSDYFFSIEHTSLIIYNDIIFFIQAT